MCYQQGHVLKETANEIAGVLSVIFQQSYEEETVPSDWSIARISAIYKKGGKAHPSNYRPVSFTCITGNIMEHIVCSQICRHLDHNSTLHPNQYGYRKGFSCVRQFVDTIHELAYSINQKTQTDVIFLEFSKVFDKVSRDKPLHKICYHGIGGKTNTWISAFLCSRSQQVVINGQTSQSAGVLSGQEVCWGLCCTTIDQRHREGMISQMPMFTDDSILLTVKYTLPLTTSHSSLTWTNFCFGQRHGTWILMWQSVLSYRLLPRRTYIPMITSWGANKYYGLTTRTYWGLPSTRIYRGSYL